MNIEKMNPLKCRAPAIALACIFLLGLSLHAETGFEIAAGVIGFICASFFLLDVLIWADNADNDFPEIDQ
jgi:hypothetical protein